MREVREKNLEGEIELEFEGESRKLTKHITFHSFISIHTISKRVLFIDQGQGHFGLTKKHVE